MSSNGGYSRFWDQPTRKHECEDGPDLGNPQRGQSRFLLLAMFSGCELARPIRARARSALALI